MRIQLKIMEVSTRIVRKGRLFLEVLMSMVILVDYLPAPMPKQRPGPRRSPRLQGKAPENVGLDFERESTAA